MNWIEHTFMRKKLTFWFDFLILLQRLISDLKPCDREQKWFISKGGWRSLVVASSLWNKKISISLAFTANLYACHFEHPFIVMYPRNMLAYSFLVEFCCSVKGYRVVQCAMHCKQNLALIRFWRWSPIIYYHLCLIGTQTHHGAWSLSWRRLPMKQHTIKVKAKYRPREYPVCENVLYHPVSPLRRKFRLSEKYQTLLT